MLLQKAMRYYRLWIYSCNLALLVSVISFVILAAWILTDYRMALFPSVRLYHPSLLYAYLALTFQGGILQAIGCFGAIRMNERLLNTYWALMLVLLFGDAVIGVVWLFKFQSLSKNLKDELRQRLQGKYGIDPEYQILWDRIQSDLQCCGVEGPQDFNTSAWISKQRLDYPRHMQVVPRSCCRLHVSEQHHGDVPLNASCVESSTSTLIHTASCYNCIKQWLQHSAHLLSVMGFCVISFLKFCFLGILKYEIKEMIQKIKILRELDDPVTILNSSVSSRNLSQTNDKPPNGNNNDSSDSKKMNIV